MYTNIERERAKKQQKTRGNHCLLPVVSFDAVLIACHWHYWLGHIDSVSKKKDISAHVGRMDHQTEFCLEYTIWL